MHVRPVAALLVWLGGLVASAGTSQEPSRALAYALEFRLNVSRSTIPAGPLVVQLRNVGQDEHDLVIRRLRGGGPLATTRIVRPGHQGELRVRLRPGRYLLYCSVADHERRGMRRLLTVTGT